MRAAFQLVLVAIVCCLAAALPGSNPCSRGPGHWCSSLTAARACGAVAHCAQLWSRSSNPRPDPADSTEACATCRLLADDLARLAADGLDRLRSAGTAACDLVADADAARNCRRMLSEPINLPELLAAGLQPEKTCVIVGQCRPMPLADPQPVVQLHRPTTIAGTCNACPTVLEAIGASVIRIGVSPAHAIASLRRRVCPRLASPGQRAMCRQLAGRRDLYSIALRLARGDQPVQVCDALHLCSSRPLMGHPVMQLMQLQTAKANRPADPIECQVCEDLVSQARQMLRDGQTQAEIENFIENIVCNSLPPSEKDQCIKNVKEYGPIIFQLLASELDPKTVCEALGACGKTGATGSRTESRVSKPRAGPQCLMCEFVMREVDKQLSQNATQAEIEAALQQVCALLPQTVRQECDNFVQQYTPIIIQLLVNGLSPETICTVLGLCTSSLKTPVSHFPKVQQPVRAGPQCLMCELVMRELEQELSQNATQAEIEAALQQVCALLPQTVRQECDNFVQQFTPTIIQLLVNGLSPQRVCTVLGLCTQVQRPMVNRASPRRVKSSSCDTCQTVVVYIKSLLKDNATEQEIIDAVEKVCNFLPTSERAACKTFVDQYGPYVIQLLLQDLSPMQICQFIGLCPQRTLATSVQKQQPVRAGPQCLMCELVMRELEQQLSQNATQAEIEAALQQVCSLLPQTVRQECDNFVQQFTPTIIQLLVNGLSPQRVCTVLGLCTQRAPLHRPAPSKPRQSSSTACDVCQTVIQYAKSLLQENATEEEIVQLVERVCTFLPTAEQAACKSFIEQYGAYVIQLLLQDADPRQICQLLGLCTSHSSPRSLRHPSPPSPPLPDRTLRFVRPARGFPATANGLVQMVREPIV